MKKIKKYSFLVGLLIFIFILSQSDFETLLKSISRINWWYILIAYLLDFPEILSKAVLWRLAMKKQGIKYSLRNSFTMYMSGMAMGFFTPGRIGDLSRFLYLKKDGYSSAPALVSVLVERFSALAYLLIVGYFGSLFLVSNFWSHTYQPLILVITALAIIIIIFKKGWHQKILTKIFKIIVPNKFQNNLNFYFQDLKLGFKKYSLWDYGKYFFFTFISWLIFYFEFYFLAKSVGINHISFLHLSVAITVSYFFTLLPISYLGIGTRELALFIFLTPFGVNRETIIILSELVLLDAFWTALTGLFFWLKKPIPLDSVKQ